MSDSTVKVKVMVKVSLSRSGKPPAWVEVQRPVVLTSTLDGGEWYTSRFTPETRTPVPFELEAGYVPGPAWTFF
jgi:hypothetical protein